MSEKPHSILGASSAHRWLACPGSLRLAKGIPSVDTKYSSEGTAAHELAETCARLRHSADQYIGTTITVKDSAFTVTEEMAEAVQLYLDTIFEDLHADGRNARLRIEHQFHLDWLYPGMYGTNDAVIDQPFGGVLRVYDYKHGAGVAVEVLDNPQLLYYALGAAHDGYPEEIELIIVQPRAQHPDGPVRRCRLSVDELQRWAEDVLYPGAIATEDPHAPLHLGEHCKFCPAMAICPEQRDRAMVAAQEVFQPVPEAPIAPEAMSKADLKRVLDAADMVEAWFNACRAHAKMMLETGLAAPEEIGYKLVAGRASRKWTDEAEAVAIMEMVGIDPYERKIRSPAQAEKQAKKGTFNAVLTTTRGIQLAPLSDKREAIPPALMAFNTFEE